MLDPENSCYPVNPRPIWCKISPRTAFSLLPRRQVVRHLTLDQAFVGSNPAAAVYFFDYRSAQIRLTSASGTQIRKIASANRLYLHLIMSPPTEPDPKSPPTTTAANQQTRAIILAAGKSTRMKSKTPKGLHPVRGKRVITHCLDNAIAATHTKPIVVIGHAAEEMRAAIGDSADFALQTEQLGTGHAVLMAEVVAQGSTRLLVTYGDMPLLRPDTFKALIDLQIQTGAAISMLTLVTTNPRGFGRIIRNANGLVAAIVEEISCSPEQLRMNEVNPGVYCFDGTWLWQALKRITPNPRKGEYFLTDLVEIAVADGREVHATVTHDADECIGINTRVDLADTDAALRQRLNRMHMLNGVSIIDPASTYIDIDVEIGIDSVILPNTHLLARTSIGTDCVIGPNSLLSNAQISSRVEIRQSVVRDSQVDADADVGPFAHLRNNTHVCAGAHVGNFGEMKNTIFGKDSKMGHFSYLGDATVGESVNIGAGAITCNYDGVNKNPTILEDNVFVGSDTMLVAPLKIGKNARTGAGSVVTKDVPADALVVGMPARVIRRANGTALEA